MSYCLRWYFRSALVWFQCQTHQKWAGLPRTARNSMQQTQWAWHVWWTVNKNVPVSSENSSVWTCRRTFGHRCPFSTVEECWTPKWNLWAHPLRHQENSKINSSHLPSPDKPHPRLELDPEVSSNPLRIRPLELFHHHHHPPFWKRSMRPKYPQMPWCIMPSWVHSTVSTVLFWERFLDFPSCQDQSKRLRAKMQNYLNQFHNADFCLHCYVQIKVCDTDSSVSLFINHCNHKSWFINLSFMLSTSFHVVKPSGQSQRFEIIAHFWGVDLLFEHWKCNKIRFFRPRPCSAKFWKQGLDLGEARFLSHFVSTKNHTKTPVAQFLQIMLLGNIMGSHLIWLLAPLFETFAAGTKTLHLLFQIKRAAMSLFSRMDCTIAAWSFCALSMADWQNTPVTTWVLMMMM